jgi:hypothetical protein
MHEYMNICGSREGYGLRALGLYTVLGFGPCTSWALEFYHANCILHIITATQPGVIYDGMTALVGLIVESGKGLCH